MNLNSTTLAVIIIIAVVVMFLILRRQLSEREVKPGKLITFPLIMILITAGTIYQTMFSSIWGFSLILGGLIIGAFVGYFMGSHFKMRVRDDGAVMMKGSIITVLIWILLIAVKFYGETVLGGNNHLINISSMLLAMTMGTIISRQFIIYKKYREHRTAI